MKKLLKTALIGALVLSLLAGCGLTPSGSAESAAPAATAAVRSAAADTASAALLFEVDTSVSDRDASGEYDADEAVTLSPRVTS